MPEISDAKKLTRSKAAFNEARPEVQRLVREALVLERQVQNMKNRQLRGSGEGIHEALLAKVKAVVS